MFRFSTYDCVTDNKPQVLETENFTEFSEILLGDMPALGPQEDKNRYPLISPVAEWHILTRRNSSVKMMSPCVVCDIDAVSEDDMDKVRSRLSDVSHIFYTSFNHGRLKNKDDDPNKLCRFRAIIELDEEYPVSQHIQIWHATNRRLFDLVDPNTKDPSRMYTVPLSRLDSDGI